MSEPVGGWLSESQQRVWRSWLLAKTHIDEYLDTKLREFNLSLSEYELLVRLSESPDHTIRMGELAASVGHSRSRLTHTIKRMEQAGFISRRRDPEDERRVLVTLTAHGCNLRTAALAVPEMLSLRLGLEPTAVDELRDSVKALVQILGSDAK